MIQETVALPPELPPAREQARLAALRRYDILDTPPDGAFDRVTRLAARLLDVPIAIVTLVDENRIWFKSRYGLDVDEIGRDPGLCASAILQDDAWVLIDADKDPRALANPLVAGEFGLRFYAGVPLRTNAGFNLGTLCVIDKEPRSLSEKERATLKDLASLVIDQMELRLAAREAVEKKDMLLRELHHRVKNNVQILLSLVSTAERRAESKETKSYLGALRGRLIAIGSAHEAMQRAESLGTGYSEVLLRHVAEKIAHALCPDSEVQIDIEDHEMSNDILLPLALILNELLTNACKYGLDEGKGRIVIRFRRHDERFELMVRDFGRGLPEGARGHGASGLRFVEGLAEQLGGRFATVSESGTSCRLVFPA